MMIQCSLKHHQVICLKNHKSQLHEGEGKQRDQLDTTRDVEVSLTSRTRIQ